MDRALKRYVWIHCYILPSVGCMSPKSTLETVNEEFSIPAATCSPEEGRLEMFALSPEGLDVAVEPNDTSLVGEFEYSAAPKIRFDVCMTPQDEFVLKQVVIRTRGGGDVIEKKAIAKVDNPRPDPALRKAILEGNYDEMNVVIPKAEGNYVGIFVKGWAKEGRSFLTVNEFVEDPFKVRVQQGTSATFTSPVHVGVLAPGNPWGQAPWRPVHQTLVFGEGALTLEYKISGSHDGAIGYKFDAIKIRDSRVSAEEVLLSSSELSQSLVVEQTHHGLADEFVLTYGRFKYHLKPNAGTPQSDYVLVVSEQGEPNSFEFPLECSFIYRCGQIREQ